MKETIVAASALIGVTGVVCLGIIFVLFAPLLTILAINTLFNIGIAYTFGTWCAALWLTFVFASKKTRVTK